MKNSSGRGKEDTYKSRTDIHKGTGLDFALQALNCFGKKVVD
jgi:hypothetical protein